MTYTSAVSSSLRSLGVPCREHIECHNSDTLFLEYHRGVRSTHTWLVGRLIHPYRAANRSVAPDMPETDPLRFLLTIAKMLIVTQLSAISKSTSSRGPIGPTWSCLPAVSQERSTATDNKNLHGPASDTSIRATEGWLQHATVQTAHRPCVCRPNLLSR